MFQHGAFIDSGKEDTFLGWFAKSDWSRLDGLQVLVKEGIGKGSEDSQLKDRANNAD